MALVKQLQLRDEIIELEMKKNNLLIQNEILTKQNVDLALSHTELIKKSGFDPKNYLIIEREHFEVMDKIQKEFVSLEINRQDTEKKLNKMLIDFNDLSNLIIEYKKEEKIFREENKRLSIELKEITNSLNHKKFENDNLRIEITNDRVKFEAEINEKKSELKRLKHGIEIEREQIKKDNHLLGVKMKDVAIYEARLRKKYPNENIIV
jgi:hypothetical protein